jgi:hypothetical protein
VRDDEGSVAARSRRSGPTRRRGEVSCHGQIEGSSIPRRGSGAAARRSCVGGATGARATTQLAAIRRGGLHCDPEGGGRAGSATSPRGADQRPHLCTPRIITELLVALAPGAGRQEGGLSVGAVAWFEGHTEVQRPTRLWQKEL